MKKLTPFVQIILWKKQFIGQNVIGRLNLKNCVIKQFINAEKRELKIFEQYFLPEFVKEKCIIIS